MNLQQAQQILQQLNEWKKVGGSSYKEISILMKQEPTTDNMHKARALLQRITDEQSTSNSFSS